MRLQQWFKFLSCLQNNEMSGVVHSDFYPNKDVSRMSLSHGATRLGSVPNAGGSSVLSEVLSFEVLQKCFQARLVKTEMEVEYYPEGGSITDYVCDMFNTRVGVSVTRAMKFYGDFTKEDAVALLSKKLRGVNQSSKNTLEKWNKQVLHVWSANSHVTNTLVHVYDNLSVDLRSNTLVFITATTQQSSFIYENR